MKSFVEKVAFFSSAKIIQNAMKSNLDIQFISKSMRSKLDKEKSYFLYIHVPFCQEFCTFCTFHKYKYNKSTCKDYFKVLRMELQHAKDEGLRFHRLYIGGGTPLIDPEELMRTIELAKKLFDIKEVSCESTPNHIQPNVLIKFDGLIDRLSIGVQTFDDNILKEISRYDRYGSSEMIQEKIARIIDFLPVISLDLIFNFQNQNEQMLRHDMQIAKKLNPEQITTYPLMSSKLSQCSTVEHFRILQKSNEYSFYNIIREELSEYTLNNAWSFTKDDTDLSDEYTVDNSEYIGLGSGAFTYLQNQLFVNSYDLNDYSKKIHEKNSPIVAESGTFDFKKQVQYQFLLHLFGGPIDIQKFDTLFSVSLKCMLKVELYMLQKLNAIDIKDGTIYPTTFGQYLSVIMMREFYVAMDGVRDMLRKSNSK